MRKKTIFLLLLLFLVLFCSEAEGGRKPRSRTHGLAQKRQNAAADRHDLTRIEDRDQLRRFINAGLLVEVENTDAYFVSKELGEKDPDHRELYRHARPYTKTFLDRELGAANEKFGTRYEITSLVRTSAYQRSLCRSNGNAICGRAAWKRSSHLTGATVDISRIGLSRNEDAWLRRRLDKLQSAGKILYIQEYSQYCFHVMVLPSYAATRQTRKTRHR